MTPSTIIEAGIRVAKTNQGRSQIENTQFCTEGYAELGYSDPASGVIAFGNWNSVSKWNPDSRQFDTLDDTPVRVGHLLEKLGAELEWEDEWGVCDHCGKAIRLKPSNYTWKPAYWQDENGDIQCHVCVDKDPASYLEHLEGKATNAMALGLDLADHGYVLVEDDFEHGFHDGQDADPQVIGKALREQGVSRFIFSLDNVGQFDICFSVWVHESEADKLDQETFAQANKSGPSPSAGLRKSLDDAARKMDALPDIPGHPKVAQCDTTTGTAKVRVVTPQEFVDGKALDF